jgi:hypothetical protein
LETIHPSAIRTEPDLSFSTSLDVAPDEFFRIPFQNLVNIFGQLIDVLFHPLTGLNNFGVGVGLFFPLRLMPTCLFSFL